MSESDWRCPVCHWGRENADHTECLHTACQARDDLGEAARLNAQAAAEWEREWSRAVKRENEGRELLSLCWDWLTYWRWRGVAMGMQAGKAPRQELTAILDAWEKPGAWAEFCRRLEQAGVLTSADLPWNRGAPRCVLCGQAKPSLDPAGVCPACRIGTVPPSEE